MFIADSWSPMNPWGTTDGGPFYYGGGRGGGGRGRGEEGGGGGGGGDYGYIGVPGQVPDYETLEASFHATGPLLENSGNIDALCHTYLGSNSGSPDEDLHLDLGGFQASASAAATTAAGGAASPLGAPPPSTNYRAKDPRPKKEETKRRKRRTEEVYDQGICSYTERAGAAHTHQEYFIPEASTAGALTSNLYDLDLGNCRHMEQFGDDRTPFPDQEQEGVTKAVSTKIKTATRRGERGPKSWEFLVRLLAHEKTNPTLIRWEDAEEATFLLVQPTIIAQMWGARSENPNLSYNNFARALRYHYNSGALEAVSERQFMYKCGPRALEYYRLLKEEKESYGKEEGDIQDDS
ncbi:ETS translocation variant 4-like [Macrobrachium nipponense]|uniref:ETS translocation variant 4-like n=1 Tax=Macrobrachium nipponense TaxID=159736 RepID=UPI0030C7B68F